MLEKDVYEQVYIWTRVGSICELLLISKQGFYGRRWFILHRLPWSASLADPLLQDRGCVINPLEGQRLASDYNADWRGGPTMTPIGAGSVVPRAKITYREGKDFVKQE